MEKLGIVVKFIGDLKRYIITLDGDKMCQTSDPGLKDITFTYGYGGFTRSEIIRNLGEQRTWEKLGNISGSRSPESLGLVYFDKLGKVIKIEPLDIYVFVAIYSELVWVDKNSLGSFVISGIGETLSDLKYLPRCVAIQDCIKGVNDIRQYSLFKDMIPFKVITKEGKVTLQI